MPGPELLHLRQIRHKRIRFLLELGDHDPHRYSSSLLHSYLRCRDHRLEQRKMRDPPWSLLRIEKFHIIAMLEVELCVVGEPFFIECDA